MLTRQRRRFTFGQTAWMISTILLLVLLEALTLELFFVISLIGLLIMTELTMPVNLSPSWRRRLLWLVALGLAGFAYIVIRRILAILPPGVL